MAKSSRGAFLGWDCKFVKVTIFPLVSHQFAFTILQSTPKLGGLKQQLFTIAHSSVSWLSGFSAVSPGFIHVSLFSRRVRWAGGSKWPCPCAWQAVPPVGWGSLAVILRGLSGFRTWPCQGMPRCAVLLDAQSCEPHSITSATFCWAGPMTRQPKLWGKWQKKYLFLKREGIKLSGEKNGRN